MGYQTILPDSPECARIVKDLHLKPSETYTTPGKKEHLAGYCVQGQQVNVCLMEHGQRLWWWRRRDGPMHSLLQVFLTYG